MPRPRPTRERATSSSGARRDVEARQLSGFLVSTCARTESLMPPSRVDLGGRKRNKVESDKGTDSERGEEREKTIERNERVYRRWRERDGGCEGSRGQERADLILERASSSFYTRWFYIRPLSCYRAPLRVGASARLCRSALSILSGRGA